MCDFHVVVLVNDNFLEQRAAKHVFLQEVVNHVEKLDRELTLKRYVFEQSHQVVHIEHVVPIHVHYSEAFDVLLLPLIVPHKNEQCLHEPVKSDAGLIEAP